MNKFSIYILIIIAAGMLPACSHQENGKFQADSFDHVVYTPRQASGFTITSDSEGEDASVLLTVSDPWQGAQGAKRQVLIVNDDDNEPEGFDGTVIRGEAKRIVAMSSTFIAMLDKLNATDRVVGVSGIDYITNRDITNRRESITDVGNETAVDFERLIAAKPDLVLIYGVSGPSIMEPKLKELAIPYVYVGDYLEQSPLAKAEWMVALGEMIGERERAVAVYDSIEARYNKLVELTQGIEVRPKVMINMPYGDAWFMPSTGNYMAKLINDAGGEYIYRKNNTSSSVPIDMEEAYMLVGNADVWINPGQVNTKKELVDALPRFAESEVVRQGEIYNNNRRQTRGGGNDFYESGVVNPDVVLADLITVLHPELANGPLSYYKRLE